MHIDSRPSKCNGIIARQSLNSGATDDNESNKGKGESRAGACTAHAIMRLMSTVLPRWLMRLLVASATVMAVIGWFGLRIFGVRADWMAYYAAGHFVLERQIANIYDFNSLQAWQAPLIGDFIIVFLYAPVYSLAFAPLALLPVQIARVAWLVIGLATSLTAAWLSTRWSGLKTPVNVLALLAFPPLVYSLAVGQISPITLLIFTFVASLEWREKRGYLPGLAAGLALYKPQLLIPLVLFWLFKKRWRSLTGFIFSAAMVGLISLLVSPQATLAYLRLSQQFMHMAEDTNASGANASIYAIYPWAGILVALGVIMVLFFVAHRGTNRYVYAMLWLAPVLVTPYIIIYDLLLLALPISILLPFLSRDRLLQITIALIWITPLLAIVIQSTRPVTLSALGLFILCAYRFFKIPFHESSTNEMMNHPASSQGNS
ncbi:glycosyltransferase family 87 protein [Chloroflexota bacterium]